MGRNYFKLEDVSQEYLNQVFDYQEGKLIWKSPLAKWVKVGSEAGYKRVDGYCVVNIGGSPKLVHRIIWKMIYGQSPSLIDHIDQNPTNNKVENLRPYSKRLNAYNISKLFSHNTSGIRGISRSANLNWIVSCQEVGKYKRKTFNCLGQALRYREAFLERSSVQ